MPDPENMMSKRGAEAFGGVEAGELPSRARVVIVGGGIVGCSVAYHLGELGWTDVVVLERDRLSSGTSWHAAGLVAQVRPTHALTALSSYAPTLYERLGEQTGVATGFKRVGALTVARTPERMTEISYGVSMARDFGIDAEVLPVASLRDWWPPIATDDLIGGTVFPHDGTLNPGDTTLALAKGAMDAGARLFETTKVTGVRTERGALVGVSTDRGDIETEIIVNATGLWARDLARSVDVTVPLFAAEHMYVMTEPALGAQERLPILRDLDGYFYVRHNLGRFVIGAFEPNGKPRPVGSIPRDDGFVEFGPDWDHFALPLGRAKERLPELEHLGFEHFLNGPESFTPDANFYLGEAPGLRGFFLACGFNSQGVIYAPGAGRALAEWIAGGAPQQDLVEVSPARVARFQDNPAYLFERTRESLGRLYGMHWPHWQPGVARGVRRTPLYDQLERANASFGEAAGWERAMWFAPAGAEPVADYSFGTQSWAPFVADECAAARERVALFDLSTYAKFLVQGRGAAARLQELCSADLEVQSGKVVYTCLLNERGGIEMDLTVTRLASDRFLVVAPTLAQVRVGALLDRVATDGAEAVVTDVTSGYAVLAIMGPRSRELLRRLTEEDVSDAAFGWGTAQQIDVAMARATALRLSFVGELGWELFVPTEFAAGIYDSILDAGAEFDLRHAGFHALDSLRSEKGYVHWGHDIGPMDTPWQAGLGFTVGTRTAAGFVGRDAVAAARTLPLSRRLVHLRLDDPERMLFHGESILRDGQRVGEVSSAAFGFTLGACVGRGWVHADPAVDDAWIDGAPFEIEVAAERVPATVSLTAFYDPSGHRLRG
ncbi:MAG: FAD-dependent oxidoreductase [Actinomycetota bacterium]